MTTDDYVQNEYIVRLMVAPDDNPPETEQLEKAIYQGTDLDTPEAVEVERLN